MPSTFVKGPRATLDYIVDWSDWLGTDTISDVTWTVPTGLTKTKEQATDTAATIWLSGGTLGETYQLVCHIETAGGREDDRRIVIRISDR